jgi:hypothetical protein
MSTIPRKDNQSTGCVSFFDQFPLLASTKLHASRDGNMTSALHVENLADLNLIVGLVKSSSLRILFLVCHQHADAINNNDNTETRQWLADFTVGHVRPKGNNGLQELMVQLAELDCISHHNLQPNNHEQQSDFQRSDPG